MSLLGPRSPTLKREVSNGSCSGPEGSIQRRSAPTDRAAIELLYLIVLTRKPTVEELAHFEARLAGSKGDTRAERMSDAFWTLVNATEFSWNH